MTQAYNLSQLANNLNTSGKLDATDGLVNAVPIVNGGTGASSVAAAVSNLSPSIYPVGSIYINAEFSTNPSILLGFGTWIPFGSGRVLVGVDPTDSAFDTLGENGGSKNAVVVSHNHEYFGYTSEIGNHTHIGNNYTEFGNGTPVDGGHASNDGVNYLGNRYQTTASGGHYHSYAGFTVTAGGSATNANLQPYITVHMWRRVS